MLGIVLQKMSEFCFWGYCDICRYQWDEDHQETSCVVSLKKYLKKHCIFKVRQSLEDPKSVLMFWFGLLLIVVSLVVAVDVHIGFFFSKWSGFRIVVGS